MPSSSIVGRIKEKKRFAQIIKSKKSEFVAVFGRRRVGKTYLIREFFDQKFSFYMSGLSLADTKQQLYNFDTELKKQSNLVYDVASENWLEAFQRLITHLETYTDKAKKVIFIDELPWFDTQASDFMTALEHFWNKWASGRKDILLIVCGSATSWMINELINNPGGLHNRVTQQMRIAPFTLLETEEMLKSKQCKLDRYQIIQLYMCIGGLPYYLDAIQPGLSVAQNIQELFFEKGSLLRNEFSNLYKALFKKHEVYEHIVEVLSTKTYGINRRDIVAASKLASGGTLTKILTDLEESGFISSYYAIDSKQKNIIYRLSDYYTAFYFSFIKNKVNKTQNQWLQWIDNPQYRAWQGFTFEQVCLDHVDQIKVALGISGIQSHNASWRGTSERGAAQVDLLIDRRDHTINLCECKFSIDSYVISKSEANNLRSKLALFKEVSKTKKAVHITYITPYGLISNMHSDFLVQNEVTMDDLFK